MYREEEQNKKCAFAVNICQVQAYRFIAVFSRYFLYFSKENKARNIKYISLPSKTLFTAEPTTFHISLYFTD